MNFHKIIKLKLHFSTKKHNDKNLKLFLRGKAEEMYAIL